MKKRYITPAMRIVSLHIEFSLMNVSQNETELEGCNAWSKKKESSTISWGVSDWEEDKGWNVDF